MYTPTYGWGVFPACAGDVQYTVNAHTVTVLVMYRLHGQILVSDELMSPPAPLAPPRLARWPCGLGPLSDPP